MDEDTYKPRSFVLSGAPNHAWWRSFAGLVAIPNHLFIFYPAFTPNVGQDETLRACRRTYSEERGTSTDTRAVWVISRALFGPSSSNLPELKHSSDRHYMCGNNEAFLNALLRHWRAKVPRECSARWSCVPGLCASSASERSVCFALPSCAYSIILLPSAHPSCPPPLIELLVLRKPSSDV